jgi:hypothetical protein
MHNAYLIWVKPQRNMRLGYSAEPEFLLAASDRLGYKLGVPGLANS